MNHEIHEPRRNTKVHEEVMTKAFLRETSCPSWFKIQMAATQSPYPRNPRHPILTVDGLTRPGVFLRRQNACRGRNLCSRHLATDRAGRDPHLRIIPNPFRLSHIAARHYVDLAAFLSKPHRSGDPHSCLAKRCQRNVILTLNGGGNLTRHETILEWPRKNCSARSPFPLSSLVRDRPARLLLSHDICYKPEHA